METPLTENRIKFVLGMFQLGALMNFLILVIGVCANPHRNWFQAGIGVALLCGFYLLGKSRASRLHKIIHLSSVLTLLSLWSLWFSYPISRERRDTLSWNISTYRLHSEKPYNEVEIPFEDHHGHILVEARIGDQTVKCLVDTGVRDILWQNLPLYVRSSGSSIPYPHPDGVTVPGEYVISTPPEYL